MSSYLVTGIAGFIGSSLARKLIKTGHEVVGIDNLSTGFRSAIPDGAIFIEGDCQNELIYRNLPKRDYQAIFHIAGQSSGEISFDNPVYDLQSNTQSTLLLLKYALKNDCKKFIYASTMSVYGAQPDTTVCETASTVPLSFYGIGKLASEQYIRLYRQYGIDGTSLRLFNVYGPGQNLENMRQGMVSIYLAQALYEHHIHVKGSQERFRDFVYIDDVVNAFIKIEKASLISDDVYNVGTGVRTTVASLVDKIRTLLPPEVTVQYDSSTLGDMFGITSDSSKILRDLNWQANTSLDNGLSLMTDWAMERGFRRC